MCSRPHFGVVFGRALLFFWKDPAVKKAIERKAKAEEILRIIGMSHAMAEATAQGLQINCLFQLPLITKEMQMEGCPCLQKSRHWKGVLAFQDKYFKWKNSESFVLSYIESLQADEATLCPIVKEHHT